MLTFKNTITYIQHYYNRTGYNVLIWNTNSLIIKRVETD